VAVDDPPLSRLSRAGVRATRQVALAHLRAGEDWQPGGVLEHRVEAQRVDGAAALPPEWHLPDARDAASAWTEDSTAAHRSAAGLRPDSNAALWHPQGAWVRPAQLVRALLAHDRIEWLGGCAVASMALRPASDVFGTDLVGDEPPPWQLLDATGQVLAEAELVVLAAGYATRALLNDDAPPLQAVRGQVSWGPMDADLAAALPPFPVNGHGSVVAGVPVAPGDTPDTGGGARLWVVGASYERDVDEPLLKPADHAANLDRLRGLLPAAAQALESAFTSGQVRGWAGVRCATPDRLPLVGPTRLPSVWVSTAMGSRGISLAVLCGELLAAWLQQEPLPVETALARRVHSGRFDRGAGKG
jgi:tRNA 5-methylaminomethyl-2-thiouridine biosynthesis bifunctional protein